MKRKQKTDIFGKPVKKKNSVGQSKKKTQQLTKAYKGFCVPDTNWVIDKIPLAQVNSDDFFENYVLPRKPVILTGVTKDSDFSQLKKWSNSYLKKNAGDATLQIEHRQTPKSNFGEEAPRKPMKFGEFLDHIDSDSNMYYLTSQTEDFEGSDLPAVIAQPLSQLIDDITVRPKLMGGLVPYQLNMWMGNAKHGSSSGLHHDFQDNLYILLRGAKRFNLFSPADSNKMYLRGHLKTVLSNGMVVYRHGEGLTEDGIPELDYKDHCQKNIKTLEERIDIGKKRLAELEEEEVVMNDRIPVDVEDMLVKEIDWSNLTKTHVVCYLNEMSMLLEELIDQDMELMLKYEGEEEAERLFDDTSDCTTNKHKDNTSTEPLNNTPQPALSHEEIFPHFSAIPLPVLYAMEPRTPPQITAVLTGADLSTSDDEVNVSKLYSQLSQILPVSSSIEDLPVALRNKYSLALNEATKASVIVLPGEALYLPASWFHEVSSFNLDMEGVVHLENDSTDISYLTDNGHIALNYWFHSPPLLSDEDREIANIVKFPYKNTFWITHWLQHYSKYNKKN